MISALKLFKELQRHVAAVNELASKLYNEQIDVADAHAKAVAEIEATLGKIRE